MQRLLLIDGHYYAFRSFYAIRHLSNSRGEPTNAVYGYVKSVQRMLLDLKPDRAAVIFDEGPPIRLTLHSEYKGKRAQTPEALIVQLPIIQQMVKALGLQYISIYGEEADDLIASYTQAALKQNYEVILATNDKDLMQLVGEHCFIYQTQGEEFTLLNAQAVEEKWGVYPNKIIDLLMLTGDAVDNIPGVPGIGPKTAAALIQQFGSVEALLQDLEKVSSTKQRELLKLHQERILLNRSLLELRDRLTLPIPLEQLLIQPDYLTQAKLFEALEFKKFFQEAKNKTASPAPTQAELF